MSLHPGLQQIDSSPAQGIPSEWLAELEAYDPRSHEYGELTRTLGNLAAAEGVQFSLPLSEAPVAKDSFVVARGYLSMEAVPNYTTRIAVTQFAGVIKSLACPDDTIIEASVTELVTDAHATIRVCDLRTDMTAKVQKGGPVDPGEIGMLDDRFYQDLKLYAETGRPRNTVTSVAGVGYSKVNGTKIRAYWMAVTDKTGPGGMTTVARLADCSDSTSSQADLYRRVFDRKM